MKMLFCFSFQKYYQPKSSRRKRSYHETLYVGIITAISIIVILLILTIGILVKRNPNIVRRRVIFFKKLGEEGGDDEEEAVSYTHLTLPTILLV